MSCFAPVRTLSAMLRGRVHWFVCLLGLLPLSLPAQYADGKFSKDFWHGGELDTKSGETLRGTLQYNIEENTVVIRIGDGTTRSFTPNTADAFQFTDALTGQQRIFYALPYAAPKMRGYAQPIFFELLSEGEWNLLCQEKLENRYNSYYDPYLLMPRSYAVTVLVFQYFLMDRQGNIQPLSATIDGLQAAFPQQADALKDWVKDQKLDLTRREDMVLVIRQANRAGGR